MLSCLVGSCRLSVALSVSPSTVTLNGRSGSWRRGRKEKSTSMAKVGSEGDSASPLTSVQVKGSFASAGPSVEKL